MHSGRRQALSLCVSIANRSFSFPAHTVNPVVNLVVATSCLLSLELCNVVTRQRHNLRMQSSLWPVRHSWISRSTAAHQVALVSMLLKRVLVRSLEESASWTGRGVILFRSVHLNRIVFCWLLNIRNYCHGQFQNGEDDHRYIVQTIDSAEMPRYYLNYLRYCEYGCFSADTII